MYNVAFQTMNNLVLPNNNQPKKEMSNSLLARNTVKNDEPKKEDVNKRIARYVSLVRDARMELKNG
tara:strand:+ start:265 stop:462 length:198 start_codon:yes stop_codon:yes gene_type:complete